MQFLTLSRRRTEAFSDAEFAARRDAEIAAARALYADGVLRHIWNRGDMAGACLLLEAASEADAREKLNTLPLYKAGMVEFTLIPLKPYVGFTSA